MRYRGCSLVSREGILGTGQSVVWLFWYFVCMLLFFSNQEAGFGISICLIPWDVVGGTSLGLEKQGKTLEVIILQTRRPRTPEPCYQEPKMSRLMWGMGNQVWKFQKGRRPAISPTPNSLTGEGERRGQPVQGCPS